MTGFTALLGKELLEIARTWRGWVLFLILLFFAITGAPLALYTPQILASLSETQALSIALPDPTYLDAYAQWIKNLEQLGIVALIISSGGIIAGELGSNTAAVVLSKRISRPAFVLAKFVAQVLFVSVAVVITTAVAEVATTFAFGATAPADLFTAAGSWLVFAWMMVAIVVWLSALVSPLAAGGLGVGTFFAVSLLGLFRPLAEYSPAGVSAVTAALMRGAPVTSYWPLVTGVLVTVVALIGAVAAFSRREV